MLCETRTSPFFVVAILIKGDLICLNTVFVIDSVCQSCRISPLSLSQCLLKKIHNLKTFYISKKKYRQWNQWIEPDTLFRFTEYVFDTNKLEHSMLINIYNALYINVALTCKNKFIISVINYLEYLLLCWVSITKSTAHQNVFTISYTILFSTISSNKPLLDDNFAFCVKN